MLSENANSGPSTFGVGDIATYRTTTATRRHTPLPQLPSPCGPYDAGGGRTPGPNAITLETFAAEKSGQYPVMGSS